MLHSLLDVSPEQALAQLHYARHATLGMIDQLSYPFRGPSFGLLPSGLSRTDTNLWAPTILGVLHVSVATARLLRSKILTSEFLSVYINPFFFLISSKLKNKMLLFHPEFKKKFF